MNSTAHVDEIAHGKVMEIDLHGRLTRQDYERFVPETEKLIRERGKLRILVTMHDFDGWDTGALWEDLKWDVKHFNDIERLAIVGEERWHKWMAGFCKPFTTATVRYFTFAHIDQAHAWLDEL
jgi:hypothetical protein